MLSLNAASIETVVWTSTRLHLCNNIDQQGVFADAAVALAALAALPRGTQPFEDWCAGRALGLCNGVTRSSDVYTSEIFHHDPLSVNSAATSSIRRSLAHLVATGRVQQNDANRILTPIPEESHVADTAVRPTISVTTLNKSVPRQLIVILLESYVGLTVLECTQWFPSRSWIVDLFHLKLKMNPHRPEVMIKLLKSQHVGGTHVEQVQ